MPANELCSVSEPVNKTPFYARACVFPAILGERAVVVRLRLMPGITPDGHVVNSALIYDENGLDK